MNSLKILTLIVVTTITAWAADTYFQTDRLLIGRPATGDKTIQFKRSNGSTQPSIRWSESNSALQFSNDGTSFANFLGSSPNTNIVVSPAITNTCNSTGSFVDVVVLGSITSQHGHPIVIGLKSDSSTGLSNIEATGGANGLFSIFKGGTEISSNFIGVNMVTVASALNFIDTTVSVGNTVTYTLRERIVSGSGTVCVQASKFYAYEL